MRAAAAFLVAVSCLAVPVAAQSASTPPLYDVREIAVPDPWRSVVPTALANGGTVAGYVMGAFIHGAPTRPFVYSDAGEMTFAASSGEALGLNELGDVVGAQHQLLSPPYPFAYANGVTETLNPFDVVWWQATGKATGVNESRQVVGAASNGSAGHAFLLQLPATSGALDLHPEGAASSSAVAINDLGEVVGLVMTAGVEHGVLWRPVAGGMQMTDLEAELGQDFSPSALNNNGVVVGDTTVAGQSHAARLVGGVLSDLGVLGGGWSKALGVSDAGQIVGYAVAADGPMRAFVWTDGVLYDLNERLTQTPGLGLQQAAAVNEAGQVVAWGATGDTPETMVIRAFILTPTTPATVIEGLIKEIQGLVTDGELKLGQGKSLINKLEQALATLESDPQKAITMLEAFVHEVRAFKNAGILDPGQADDMIARAEAAIASIPG